jgi:hypothetical protein
MRQQEVEKTKKNCTFPTNNLPLHQYNTIYFIRNIHKQDGSESI